MTSVLNSTWPRELCPPESEYPPGYFREAVGTAGWIIDRAGLNKNSHVLDVGCGWGKVAVGLADFLDPRAGGEYHGFDPTGRRIKWCQEQITTRYAHCRFLLVDIFNPAYWQRGALLARHFQFPYDAGYFDAVVLLSVFTHMLPPDVTNYMGEISRVLKKGGRSLITYYLINDATRQAVREGKTLFDFSMDKGDYLTTSHEIAERAIAYPDAFVLSLYERTGFSGVEIIRGEWMTKKNQHQDLIVARKD